MQFTTKGILDMARTIWGEARSETYKGKLAVGFVILNRLRNPGWWTREQGDDIKDDTLSATVRDPWQFSSWNEGDPNRPRMKALHFEDIKGNGTFADCMAAALEVLNGDVSDPTKRADHYFAEYIDTPEWAKETDFTVQIGTHRFYRIYI